LAGIVARFIFPVFPVLAVFRSSWCDGGRRQARQARQVICADIAGRRI
jgi:hypothetical protein